MFRIVKSVRPRPKFLFITINDFKYYSLFQICHIACDAAVTINIDNNIFIIQLFLEKFLKNE